MSKTTKAAVPVGGKHLLCEYPKKKLSLLLGSSSAVIFGMALAPVSYGFQFENTHPDISARWDNTLKYSAGFRVKDRDDELAADRNLDDGNRNFDKGLISNRLDLLSEFDLWYKNYGARLSGAAWYDTVYNESNDNDSPETANAFSVPHDRFTDETREVHGRDAELLDAYVFGRFDLDGRLATLRVGKHTVLYGESLFFGANGVAGAQAPVDIVKAVSVPGSQVKEILRPVNQITLQMQLTPNLSFGAYYQLEWEKNRLPGVGSYFSGMDIAGPGAERLLFADGDAAYFLHTGDREASDSGQGGVQFRFRPSGGDIEYGLYALNYHSKMPWVIPNPGEGADPSTGQIGTYHFVYPEDIRLYGLSFSTSVGDANVAGEFSLRDDAPLAAPAFVPTGKTAHAQISTIMAFGRTDLWDTSSVAAEIAWNRLLSVDDNEFASALDPRATRDSWGMRVLFEPTWFQVMPAVDISAPINIGYSGEGRSAAAPVGVHEGGDVTIGLSGDYARKVKFGLSYTHYFGSAEQMLVPETGYSNSYKQYMKDKNFISLNVQRTF